MYLVIGASGFIGSYFIKNVLKMTDDKIIAVSKNIFEVDINPRVEWLFGDLCQSDFIHTINKMISDEQNVKIAYFAGIASPEYVFDNPRSSFALDVVALAAFVNTVENIDTLYYASSEAVFSGGATGYKFKDDDAPVSMNLYGRHKVAAEAIIAIKGFNTVRFPVMIGRSLSSSRPHFFDVILNKLKNGEKIEMFIDSVRSLTDFDTATYAMLSLMENPEARQYPAVNIACDKALSKYELGIMITEKYGFDRSLVIPVSQNTLNIFKDKRENIHLLDNTLLKSLLGTEKLELNI